MKPYVMKGIKKIPWRITLPDDTKVTLQPPKIGAIAEMENVDAGDPMAQAGLVAKLLSSNLEGKKFTKNDVLEQFDFADLQDFMTKYFDYISEFSGAKN